MLEIFEKLNRNSHNEKNEISLLNNPEQYLGASITNEHRLLYFENNQHEPVYIDFFEQYITSNKLYIVPSRHLLYIPLSTKNYHCFIVPEATLSDFEKCWIYMFKYKTDKSIDFSIQTIKIFQKNFLTQFFKLSALEIRTNSFPNLYNAKQLCNLIENTNFTHNLTVTGFSQKLCVTQPTLWRVCNSIFYSKPQTILRYHLLLKIIYCLISNRQTSIYEIADDLGFKDVTTFSRFIKIATNYSPTEIRNKYEHINI